MREIKFRAIAADSRYNMENYYRKMIYSNSLIQMSGEDEEVYLKLNGEGWIEVDEKTVGRYTGLKDKNGKEIYEGDIVEAEYCIDGCLYYVEDEYGVVQWDKKECGFNLMFKDELTHSPISYYVSFAVIGNIYENPELLEV